MGVESSRNSPTDPQVIMDTGAMLKEISRLCGVNGITPANKNAAIALLSDAQMAQLMRQILTTGVILLP